MTYFIPKANRQTDFWEQRTPAVVGPGSYTNSPQTTSRNSSVPFSVGSHRPLSTLPHRYRGGSPGPGAYDSKGLEKRGATSKYGTSAFTNRVSRPEPMIAAAALSSYPTFCYPSPGPGAYEIPGMQEKPSFRQTGRRQKTALLEVVPGAPSIPYSLCQLGRTAEDGSGRYDASDVLTRSKGKSVDFSASKVKRKLWDVTTSMETPGPGHYDVSLKQKKGKSDMSVSSGEKLPNETSQGPGPGSYAPALPVSTTFSQISSFGSQAKRSPLWLQGTGAPGVGSYNLQHPPLELSQKRQLAEATGGDFRPPFLTARKRDCLQTVEEGGSPGPGSYNHRSSLRVQNFSAFVETGKVKFMTTQPRFKGLFEPKTGPDPGQYAATDRRMTSSETAHSLSPRFKPYARDNLQVSVSCLNETPPVGKYKLRCVPHRDLWKKPPFRHGQSPNSSFESSVNRFDPKEPFPGEKVKDIPGPGYYKRRPTFASTEGYRCTVGQSKRFQGYGDYIPASSGSVGPGRYHKEQSLLRQSFNIAVKRL